MQCLQCKNKRLLQYKSSLDIYKRHEVHQKDNVRGWCQKVRKNSKKKRKERECFSNMTFMIGK